MDLRSYRWKQLRKAVLQRDGHTCTWCGNSEGKMEVDHIQARVAGGDDTMSNLQTLCQQCHINKTKKDSVFWSKKTTPPYHIAFFSPKGRIDSATMATRAIVGDSEAFGLDEAGE